MSYANKTTGININYNELPTNINSSMHPEAIKYRRASARISNAIEGVVLSKEDKNFMDNIPVGMSKQAFKQAVLNHLRLGGV